MRRANMLIMLRTLWCFGFGDGVPEVGTDQWREREEKKKNGQLRLVGGQLVEAALC